jgi:hypothetical protein
LGLTAYFLYSRYMTNFAFSPNKIRLSAISCSRGNVRWAA